MTMIVHVPTHICGRLFPSKVLHVGDDEALSGHLNPLKILRGRCAITRSVVHRAAFCIKLLSFPFSRVAHSLPSLPSLPHDRDIEPPIASFSAAVEAA